jgi:hypothetical protein
LQEVSAHQMMVLIWRIILQLFAVDNMNQQASGHDPQVSLFVFSLNVNHDVLPDVWGLVSF